jgi:hypothetical protein
MVGRILTSSAEKQQEQDKVAGIQHEVKKKKEEFRNETAAANKEIQNKKRLIEEAKRRVIRAQDEVDRVKALPKIEEPDYFEELNAAQHLAGPLTAAPKLGDCGPTA